MTSDTFKQFVATKVAEAAELQEHAIDWEAERKDWQRRLVDLNADVRRWLDPFISEQSVRVTTEQVPLSEENIGDYDATMTVITIGNAVVRLKPIGTLLIGARGRVDMEGPKGVARLVVVPKNATGPKVRVEVLLPGEAPKPAPKAPPVDDWVWKLATTPPKITYVDLSEDSFLDALMGVVNGRD